MGWDPERRVWTCIYKGGPKGLSGGWVYCAIDLVGGRSTACLHKPSLCLCLRCLPVGRRSTQARAWTGPGGGWPRPEARACSLRVLHLRQGAWCAGQLLNVGCRLLPGPLPCLPGSTLHGSKSAWVCLPGSVPCLQKLTGGDTLIFELEKVSQPGLRLLGQCPFLCIPLPSPNI